MGSPPWGSSKATWTQPWAPCSGVPAGTGAGGDEPRGFFPHQPCWDTVTPPFWFALLKRTTKSWFLSQIWLLVPWPPIPKTNRPYFSRQHLIFSGDQIVGKIILNLATLAGVKR